ncbi:MAG: hypothetical protein N2712_06895 [Brevinematales bacterium]|nr:hypothetical protein [Brevinematales bacterium]
MKKILQIVTLIMLSTQTFGGVIKNISTNSYIDWTKGVIVIDYISTENFLVSRTFAEDINRLKYTIKRKIVSEALNNISGITFDENRKVEDILTIFPEKRENIISLLEKTEIQNFRYFSGKVMSRYTIDIFGEKGIFEILKLPSIPRNYKEFLNLSEPKEYTGIIISTKKHKLNLALSMKIVSKSGKLIYSYADYKGKEKYINVFKSLEEAIKSEIFGDNILLIFPVEIAGENKTDIVVEDSIIEKILSSDENHNILYNGKIGIIVED